MPSPADVSSATRTRPLARDGRRTVVRRLRSRHRRAGCALLMRPRAAAGLSAASCDWTRRSSTCRPPGRRHRRGECTCATAVACRNPPSAIVTGCPRTGENLHACRRTSVTAFRCARWSAARKSRRAALPSACLRPRSAGVRRIQTRRRRAPVCPRNFVRPPYPVRSSGRRTLRRATRLRSCASRRGTGRSFAGGV